MKELNEQVMTRIISYFVLKYGKDNQMELHWNDLPKEGGISIERNKEHGLILKYLTHDSKKCDHCDDDHDEENDVTTEKAVLKTLHKLAQALESLKDK